MFCRYRCDVCDRWHALARIPTNQLFGAWLSFVMDPPYPFTAQQWDLIMKAEIERRRR